MARPEDLVERASVPQRPDQLWVVDFTYVATWGGFTYVAFCIDVYSRMITGWRASTVDDHRPGPRRPRDGHLAAPATGPLDQGLVHHSDAGSQYTSIRSTERLAEAGAKPSIGSVGDSYDNAMAESIIGLFKTEVIRRRGPWRGIDDVEIATLQWVDWYNNNRLFEAIGDIPPAEAETDHYLTAATAETLDMSDPTSTEPGRFTAGSDSAGWSRDG